MKPKESQKEGPYINCPELLKFQKYTLDKGRTTECEVILLNFGKIYGEVCLPYCGLLEDKPKSMQVMLNRLTKINTNWHEGN